MKSFCIKNNNEEILNYLLRKIENINMDELYISKTEFKYYKNIIVHYKGTQSDKFINKLSLVLTKCVIKFYEKKLIKTIVATDYFYFNDLEREIILNNCEELLIEDALRKEQIFLSTRDYIEDNKFFILDGFVNFRLFKYKNQLSEIVDSAVNKYIIDKEYHEFVQLLKAYINSQKSRTGTVHVIYKNEGPILLDESGEVIVYEGKYLKPKYLSDISFSSKDYCLNELLNLLPQKIIVHLITELDEFINTLQLIFKGRIIICEECNVCNTFRILSAFGVGQKGLKK